MKKLLAIVLCLSVFAGIFAGCDTDEHGPHVPTGDALVMEGQDPDSVGPQKEQEPQEFSLVYYPEKSMNPMTCADYTNRVLFSLIYQNLFNVDNQGNTEPILCSRYKVSSDGMVWTFYIENNVTFSDGTLMTIDDVYATFQAALESPYYKGRFTHVSKLELSGDGGIKFTLRTPYENFAQLLDVPILKASEVDAPAPLGSGPYSLAESLAGPYLRRVMTWWCEGVDLVVTAETIPLVEAKNAAQIRDQFEFFDVGLVLADPCSDMYAEFRCDYELWDIDNGIFIFLACNVRWVDFMEDTTLRSMLTYGIDRESLVRDNIGDYGMPATLAASPASPYYKPSLAERYAYDPTKFIEFLGRYGKTEEPIRLMVNSDDSVRLRIARDIVEAFNEYGLPMKLLEYDSATFHRELYNANYDLYLGMTRLSVNYDLSAFFAPWGNLSRNGISDQEIYELCLESLANSGNYYNLLQKVADDGRIIPIAFYSYAVYATRGLLTDLTPARDNTFAYSLGKTMQEVEFYE